MRDIAATSLEEMLQRHGAGAVARDANPDSTRSRSSPATAWATRPSASGHRRRRNPRDGFSATGPANDFGTTATGITSNFDVERAEVITAARRTCSTAPAAGRRQHPVSEVELQPPRRHRVLARRPIRLRRGQLDFNVGADWLAFRFSYLDDSRRNTAASSSGYATRLLPSSPTQARPRAHHRPPPRPADDQRAHPQHQPGEHRVHQHRHRPAPQLRPRLHAAQQPRRRPQLRHRPAWPRGAIADGKLTWDNINSCRQHRLPNTSPTRFSPPPPRPRGRAGSSPTSTSSTTTHLSDRATGGIATSPPAPQRQSLATWASGATLADTEQPTRRWAVRGSAILANALFRDRAQPDALGYDISGPTPPDRLRRLLPRRREFQRRPRSAHPPPASAARRCSRPLVVRRERPAEKNRSRPPAVSPRVTYAGANYMFAWRTTRATRPGCAPTIPSVLAARPASPGVSAQNNDGHNWENHRTRRLYASITPRGLATRFATLAGLRTNETSSAPPASPPPSPSRGPRAPSRTSPTTSAFNFRLSDVFPPYYSFIFHLQHPAPSTPNDPLGNAPRPVSGTGHEGRRVKFNSATAASGSVQYFTTQSKDDDQRRHRRPRSIIPTVSMARKRPPPARRTSGPISDRTTSGLEVIFTAGPAKNWRVRLPPPAPTARPHRQRYPLLWNDQFFVRNGAVTYQDGVHRPDRRRHDPARIATLNAQLNPAAIQNLGTWAPLTVAMMNDRAGPYWAQPADDNGRLRRANSGACSSSSSAPTAATHRQDRPARLGHPHFWSDPNGTKGETVVAKKGREHRRLRAIPVRADEQLHLHRRQLPQRRRRQRRRPSRSA